MANGVDKNHKVKGESPPAVTNMGENAVRKYVKHPTFSRQLRDISKMVMKVLMGYHYTVTRFSSTLLLKYL